MMHFFTYSRIFPRIFIFLWFFAHHDFDPQERDCQILKVLVAGASSSDLLVRVNPLVGFVVALFFIAISDL